ncbi:DNA polymerase III subunit delta [Chloroflexi bacterium TSY]|nr:DNA polymerase III subunit delta [Chloroflexi bacterium TSY]
MNYLILNGDEYLTYEHIRNFKGRLGEPDLADLNFTELEGASTNAGEILGSASMMPFLAPKRLFVIRGYLTQLDRRMSSSKSSDSAAHHEAAQLVWGLDDLPETSDLVFIDDIDKRRHLWKGFTQSATDKQPKQKVPGLAEQIKIQRLVLVELYAPDIKSLGGWIAQRARTKQIAIDGRAVRMLSDYVGVNLRQLDNELEKLATYAAGRPITVDDVKRLVSDASEALIWNLTDALSQRNGRTAMQSLYELRRGDANPFYLLTMMARQYRIIIKVKEAASSGMGGNEYDIAQKIKESPYPVKKALQQAQKYSAQELDDIIQRLLETDFAMKTGADADAEIDILVAELTQGR